MFRQETVSGVYAILLLLCPMVSAMAEQSDETALHQHRSQHAYNSVFGLPAVAARPVQTREWQIAVEHSNQFMGGIEGDERLLLDGETTELTFRHRQRVAACWQGELVVPFIQHGEGEFDRVIDDWHQIFGLPDAERNLFPFFQLDYLYADQDGERASVNSPQSGLGDIQISLQRSLGCLATADATGREPIARIGIKLPTGEVDELRGSGRVDVYADLQSPVWVPGSRWRTGAAIGVLAVGQTNRLAPQRSLVAYGSFGVQFVLTKRFRLLSQIDWHTPFYVSELTELGEPAVGLSVGVRYLGPADQSIELTVSEDAAIDTTPDIVARLAWVYRPFGGF